MTGYKILFDQQQLRQRITELGAEISAAYEGESVVFVSMLKGSLYFLADLSRAVTIEANYDLVAVTSQKVRMQLTRDITLQIEDKHVIVVEEIVRTGLTTNYLLQHLETKNPKSLQVCALLSNPNEQLIDLPMPFIGFMIDQTRVIGYGMDYKEHGRTLPFIAKLDKSRFTKKKQKKVLQRTR